jgi:hypothetical protein
MTGLNKEDPWKEFIYQEDSGRQIYKMSYESAASQSPYY